MDLCGSSSDAGQQMPSKRKRKSNDSSDADDNTSKRPALAAANEEEAENVDMEDEALAQAIAIALAQDDGHAMDLLALTYSGDEEEETAKKKEGEEEAIVEPVPTFNILDFSDEILLLIIYHMEAPGRFQISQ